MPNPLTLPQQRSNQRLVISFSDDAILRALHRFGLLTNEQVCRLLYRPGSLSFVREKLHRLTKASYACRDIMQRKSQHGSSPFYFWLGKKGVAYLRSSGEEDLRFFPSEHGGRSGLFLQHTLAVNDLLIAAILLTRRDLGFAIAELLPEAELKRRPLQVEIRREGVTEHAVVIPDAWLNLDQTCVALELDRGTEDQQQWRRKVRAYLAAMQGVYQRAFATDLLTIAVVATTGEHRARQLRAWTERELGERGQGLSECFLFTHLKSSPPDPEALFLSACWSQPFRDTPVSMLDTKRRQEL